jgi:hypothetical protein
LGGSRSVRNGPPTTPEEPATVASEQPKTLKENLRDLWELLLSYARQEIRDPLQGLGRYIGWGLLGSVTLSLGIVLIGLAGLRLMQEEADTVFDGNWSFAPYFILLAYTVLVMFLAYLKITREPKRRT